MKRAGVLAIIISVILMGSLCGLRAQSSSLVYPGTDDKLVYESYPNHGEDTLVNTIPDFSFSGYMQGGVPLPDSIPVRITLEPSGLEDDSAMIQDAIDQVSALPLDENGIRGAILLKKGLYKVNGTLSIKVSGVVLRGEKQLPSDQGGTEIVAMAEKLHSFINIDGENIPGKVDGFDLGEEIASFDYPEKDIWIISDVMEGVDHEVKRDSVITFVFYSIESGNYKFYSKENGDSNKIPFLEVIAYSDVLQRDDTIRIYPSDDTYVRGLPDSRDTNYGNESQVYYKLTDPQIARIGFIKFDLNDIPGSIKSALLHVMASREDQTGLNYIGYAQNDDWSEDTRTWNNTYGMLDPEKRIVTSYVGTGARHFVVEDASSFKPGDKIFVRRTPNQLWCDTLGMSKLSELDPESTDWTPESYTINHPRRITAIKGDTITIDIPVVDPMQDLYGGGEILKDLSSVSLEKSAVENMYLSSVYKSETDEDHAWDAISIGNAENCWVKNVTARYFAYSCVKLKSNASYCTIQDCAMLDPKSITTGGRKYPFPIAGGIGNLIQRCYARGGRHSFATSSRITGPHVFLDCYATETYSDIGPHHRWAAGILYDNVYGGQIRVQNRLTSGTGHGWAGVQNMFWNCHSYEENFKVESPLGGLNWAIGCTAQEKDGEGFWESYGTQVLPRSLYLQQLRDRLGEQAIENITTEEQRNGRIWDQLAEWAGTPVTGIIKTQTDHDSEAISIYPNPGTGEIYIDLQGIKEQVVKLEMFDLQGKLILVREISGGSVHQVFLSEALKGNMMLIKLSGNAFSSLHRIIVK